MKITTLVLMLLTFSIHAEDITVYNLFCKHKTNPFGIEEKALRLSWKIDLLKNMKDKEGNTELIVGSGEYTFSYPKLLKHWSFLYIKAHSKKKISKYAISKDQY